QFLYDWTIYPLPLASLTGNDVAAASDKGTDVTDGNEQPAFYQGTFKVDTVADTFLRLDGWTKGNVYVNGFNLGRYWEAGPTKTLYIPGPLLREGDNELVVFELHGTAKPIA